MAKQRYYPDLTVEGYVAYRQDFADFVGLQISVDLPLFPGDRQDRQLAAAQRLADASSERKSDISRKLHAETTQRYTDWVHYSARAKAFAEHVVPTAQRQIEAARSAYGAGRGNFSAVLRARLALLDVQMQQLALAVESARAAARLQYLVGEPQ